MDIDPLQFVISVYLCLEIACHNMVGTYIQYKFRTVLFMVVKFVSLSLLDRRVNSQKVKRMC